jgi:hypothetical protein
MVGLSALWMPIVVSAVFVLIALLILHMMPGWHKRDMTAVPGEDKVMETLRALNVQPGDYRFPYGNTVKEMETPAFKEKMKHGPVGNMSIQPIGDINMGKMLGQWFVYSLVIPGERRSDLLLLFRGALAELDLVGQGHAVHAHEHGRRADLRARDGGDVRLALAQVRRKKNEQSAGALCELYLLRLQMNRGVRWLTR